MPMNFKQFILEDWQQPIGLSAEEMASVIIEECGPFLEATKFQSNQYFAGLFKGLSGLRKGSFAHKIDVKLDRKPVDTPLEFHNILDNYFLRKFNRKFRSESTFAVGDIDIAHRYGTCYMIFPIGKFESLWSPKVQDAFDNLFKHEKFLDPINEEWSDVYLEVTKFLDKNNIKGDVLKNWENWTYYFDLYLYSKEGSKYLDYKHNKLLNLTLSGKDYQEHEVMIACKQYYAIQPAGTYFYDLIENIRKFKIS